MNLLTFLYEQPQEIQSSVGELVEAARSRKDLDVQAEVKKLFGHSYTDEQIKWLVWGTEIVLR
jgi:hypothetical protein